VLWAVLIAYLFFHGTGRWSLDALLDRPRSAKLRQEHA
jgi:putative oxidoreductase